MEKYVILGILFAAAVLCLYQYINNRKWENLVSEKKRIYSGNGALKSRASGSYKSALMVCSVAFAAVVLLPNRFMDFNGNSQDSMRADIANEPAQKSAMPEDAGVTPDSAEEEDSVAVAVFADFDYAYEAALVKVESIEENDVKTVLLSSMKNVLMKDNHYHLNIMEYSGEKELEVEDTILILLTEEPAEEVLNVRAMQVQIKDNEVYYYNSQTQLYQLAEGLKAE